MSIIRVSKNKKNPYFMMDKTGINDPRLSFKAKGLLSYLCSKPDNWYVNYHDLINSSINGVKSVRSAVHELLITGYMIRTQIRSENGRFGYYDYTVYEKPQYPKYSKNKPPPHSPNRHAEKPHAKKDTLLSNDSKRIKNCSSKHLVGKNVNNFVAKEDPSLEGIKEYTITLLYELGIKDHKKLLDFYYIGDIFEYADWMSTFISRIKNPHGFLISALNEDWLKLKQRSSIKINKNKDS